VQADLSHTRKQHFLRDTVAYINMVADCINSNRLSM